MSGGLTSGSCKFKRLMGQVHTSLGTEDSCLIPPFLLSSLAPYQMMLFGKILLLCGLKKLHGHVTWKTSVADQITFKKVDYKCIWDVSPGRAASKGCCVVGPQCATLPRRGSRRTTTTPQLALWIHLRLRRLMSLALPS